MGTSIDTQLKSFLKRPTLTKAKKAFLACRDGGLPVPEDVADFLAEQFRKDIIDRRNKTRMMHEDIDRSILVELMIRIANSKNSESIDSICQTVAEESGIQGNKTRTAGELLRKGMEEFRGRPKGKRRP